jgi:hypothetical protein
MMAKPAILYQLRNGRVITAILDSGPQYTTILMQDITMNFPQEPLGRT